jgi:hypothetical protein
VGHTFFFSFSQGGKKKKKREGTYHLLGLFLFFLFLKVCMRKGKQNKKAKFGANGGERKEIVGPYLKVSRCCVVLV